jgi:hypothetical protein
VTIGDLADRAGLEFDEVSGLLEGTDFGDLYVVARLEWALGVALWPDLESEDDHG